MGAAELRGNDRRWRHRLRPHHADQPVGPQSQAAPPEDNSPMYGEAGWHDFFLMVGGGAAALTGLVFVAMSLHLDQIALNAAHRHRARTVLTGLTAVFIRCALVLMAGQSGQAVAVELFGVLVGVEAILYLSIRQALRASETPD